MVSFMKWEEMPVKARVWVYAADRFLSNEEVARIQDHASEFIDRWSAHGKSMAACSKVFHNLFLVIAADETQTLASGCSIDDSVRFVKRLGGEMNLDFFNRMLAQYEEGGEIRIKKMHEFWALRKSGIIDGGTIVFNNLVSSVEEFNNGWRTSFEKSWHQSMWD